MSRGPAAAAADTHTHTWLVAWVLKFSCTIKWRQPLLCPGTEDDATRQQLPEAAPKAMTDQADTNYH